MSDTCRYCAGPTTSPKTGRPSEYCSVGCRRASEYEIRRLSRRLEGLERKRDDLEVDEASERSKGDSASPRIVSQITAEAGAVDGQIARYRDRLRALLDTDAKPIGADR